MVRSFFESRCLLQASALSYTTVLSVVPFLAVAFSIAKGLGFYEAPRVREVLLRIFLDREEVVDGILGYIQNTNVKTLGALGTVLLIITALSLLFTIEGTLNTIWNVSAKRGLWRRFTNYVTLTLICPPLLFAAVSVTATVQSLALTRWLLGFAMVHTAYLAILFVLPYLVVWVSFFILYKFLPFAKVNATAAGIGALLAGSLWQLVQILYITFQFSSTGYNTIYGTFAQIPLLLLWLYISWVIVLLGAIISHTVQYHRQAGIEAESATLNQADRHAIALLLVLMLAEATIKRDLPPSTRELAVRLAVSQALIEDIFAHLARANLLVEVASTLPDRVFVLLAPLATVPGVAILDALDGLGQPRNQPAYAHRFPVVVPLLDAIRARETEPTLSELLDKFGQELTARE